MEETRQTPETEFPETEEQQDEQTALPADPARGSQPAAASNEQTPASEPSADPAYEECTGEDASEASPEDKPAGASPEKDALDSVGALTRRLIASEARGAALAAGVSPERAEYVVRLADLAGIDAADEQAKEKIEQAVHRVLTDIPELAGTVVGTGSRGNHSRQSDPMESTRSAFARGLGL